MATTPQRDAQARPALLSIRAETGEPDAAKRQVHLVASTRSLDSHGTRISQNWKLERFQANPVVLWAHDRSSVPIARAIDVRVTGSKSRDDKRLEATVQFPAEGRDARADEVWRALEDGRVRGVSVGFTGGRFTRVEKAADGSGGYVEIDEPELAELSFVPIGSNPDAMVDQLRALGIEPADHHDPQAPESAETEDHPMNLTHIAVALGIVESASVTETNVLARAQGVATERERLLAATGEATVEGALGVIAAGRASVETVRTLEARVAELEAEKRAAAEVAEKREREDIVAKLRAEQRITPAQEKDLVPALSIEALRAFARTAGRALPTASVSEPSDTQPDAPVGALRWEGKSWDELRPMQRVALLNTDPTLYRQMRASAGADR